MTSSALMTVEDVALGTYRTEIRIVAEILNVIASHGDVSLNMLCVGARLSHTGGKKRCEALLERGLIAVGNDGRYVITEKGGEFMERWKRFDDLTARFGLVI